MPDFRPFRGIRYAAAEPDADLTAVAAPPYDVIDPERRAELRRLDDHNMVRLTLPDAAVTDGYEQAGRTFRDWLDGGVLALDDQPRFYCYRASFHDEDGRPRSTTGVIGALELMAPGDGDVLPHERTMPKPKGDRLELLRATRANLEPIWGLSLAAGLTDLLAPQGPALGHVDDSRGARHELFPVPDPERIAAIRERVSSAPVVIADGHHRYETSLHYRDERRAAGDPEGAHDRILALVVELSADQLAVQPIHRVVRTLPPGLDLRAALAEWFDLEAVGANEPGVVATLGRRMDDAAAPALVDDRGVALLRPRPGALDALLGSEPEPVRAVDAARFEVAVAPLLDEAGAELEYRHDRSTVAELVRKGDARAAFVLRPVDVPTIEAVARRRERMPQKTTFFHPKPSTGLVMRSLDLD